MKILLIAGGWSTEREISLLGAQMLEKTLREMGHTVEFFDLLTEFDQLFDKAKKFDFAFLNLHGTPGEDGLPQAILDQAGCPYQGSRPAGSFLALNKAAAKQIFRGFNLPTPDWEYLPRRPDASWTPSFPYPIFVKSNTGGSSLRLSRVTNHAELDHALSEIFAAGDTALLEPEISGKEITCAILGDAPLPPILIEPVGGNFFDFQNKYQKDGAREICPAPLPDETTKKIGELALAAHKALDLSDYSRSDFILTANGKPYLLEVNTLPGMTGASLVPKAAKAAGLSFQDLLARLIELGMKKAH